MRYEGKYEIFEINGKKRYIRTDLSYIPHFIIDDKYYTGHVIFVEPNDTVCSGKKYDVLVEFSLYDSIEFRSIFKDIKVGSIIDVNEASIPVGKFEVTNIL